jgi:hypothetical protein
MFWGCEATKISPLTGLGTARRVRRDAVVPWRFFLDNILPAQSQQSQICETETLAARPHAAGTNSMEIILDSRLNTGYIQPMKTASRPRLGKGKVNLQSQLFTLSNAKTYLGRLMEKAGRGETVYIVRGRQRFVLQEVPEIEPIPIRPPDYFASAYSRAEIQEDNRLAKASVIRAPKDLE